jgi:hypothetical protein
MSGGNIIVDSVRQTMAAPGSEPVDPLPPADERTGVTISAETYDTPVLRDSDGAPVRPDGNPDRPAPASEDDGHGWLRGRDTDAPDVFAGLRGKPVIQYGQWNWDSL